MNVIIDANVLATANFKADHADLGCIRSCIELLGTIQQNSLDSNGEIFKEYGSYSTHKGQPGVGDAFFKWLYDNQGYDSICEKVQITPHDDRGYEEFPDDPSLSTFDRSDRKYIAVAIKSQRHPVIHNAVDSDWKPLISAFGKYDVIIKEICE